MKSFFSHDFGRQLLLLMRDDVVVSCYVVEHRGCKTIALRVLGQNTSVWVALGLAVVIGEHSSIFGRSQFVNWWNRGCFLLEGSPLRSVGERALAAVVAGFARNDIELSVPFKHSIILINNIIIDAIIS